MQALGERILVLDGAMGTMIQAHALSEADFRGSQFADHARDVRGNNDLLSITQPDLIRDIHAGFLAAGADIIETNTFNSTAIAQADYGLADRTFELNLEAARVARVAADEAIAADSQRPRWVAGVLGPTNRTASISPDVNDPGFRNVSFDELRAAYTEALRGLTQGGVDLILVETVFDTLNAKAALFAVDEYFEQTGTRLPLMISGTITDLSGRTLSGQTAEAFWYSVRHARPVAVGLNCALGATELRPHVDDLARLAETHVSCHPNAWTAQRVRRLRRHAGAHGRGAGGIRVGRISEPGRRMLRYNAGAHPRHCRHGRREQAAKCPRLAAGMPPVRPRTIQHRPR